MNSNFLHVSQLFGPTLQGEGVYAGVPVIVLRVQGCGLNCSFCDTKEIWRKGVTWKTTELYEEFKKRGYVDLLRNKDQVHLLVTGGSPLLQQKALGHFFAYWTTQANYLPFIEVENEAVIMPETKFARYISCWNNSPKLSNAGISPSKRLIPEVLIKLNTYKNSWFKFVLDDAHRWDEVEYLIEAGLVQKKRVILMAQGESREELEANEVLIAQLAIEKNVRFTSRLHIHLWGKDPLR